MKPRLFALLLALSLAVPVFAADAKTPELDKDRIIAIKDIQLRSSQLALSMQQLQIQYNNLEKQEEQVSAQLSSELQAAQVAVDKDRKNWVLNPSTLKFEKAPAPATPEKK